MRIRKDIFDVTIDHCEYDCPRCEGNLTHTENDHHLPGDPRFTMGCLECGFRFHEWRSGERPKVEVLSDEPAHP